MTTKVIKRWVYQCEYQDKCGQPATYRYKRLEVDPHDGVDTYETYRCDDHAGLDLVGGITAWDEIDLSAKPSAFTQLTSYDRLSACCGDPVLGGFCSGCGEHA